MTLREKAQQLVDKMSGFTIEDCKGNAIVAVDEILLLLERLYKPEYAVFVAKDIYSINETEYLTHLHGYEIISYFESLKEQIIEL